MFNKAILFGRVGRDPEARTMDNGDKVVNFSLATSKRWRDKNTGEAKEKTEWHKIVCFNQAVCDLIERFVAKGDPLGVEGEIATRKWTDQSGNNRYSTEIVITRFEGGITFLPKGGGGQSRSEDDYGQTRTRDDDYAKARDGGGGSRARYDDFEDSDIPF